MSPWLLDHLALFVFLGGVAMIAAGVLAVWWDSRRNLRRDPVESHEIPKIEPIGLFYKAPPRERPSPRPRPRPGGLS